MTFFTAVFSCSHLLFTMWTSGLQAAHHYWSHHCFHRDCSFSVPTCADLFHFQILSWALSASPALLYGPPPTPLRYSLHSLHRNAFWLNGPVLPRNFDHYVIVPTAVYHFKLSANFASSDVAIPDHGRKCWRISSLMSPCFLSPLGHKPPICCVYTLLFCNVCGTAFLGWCDMQFLFPVVHLLHEPSGCDPGTFSVVWQTGPEAVPSATRQFLLPRWK